MSKYLLLLSPCFWLFTLHGQEPISFDDFLKTSLSVNEGLFNVSANQSTFKPSWIEEVQVRTQTDEFDFDRQQYTVRVRPSTGKVRKKQKDLYELYKRNSAFQLEDSKRDFVKSAYASCLDIYSTERELDLQKELLILLNDQELVLEKLTQLPDFNVKELIDLQKDQYNLKIDIHKNERRFTSILPTGQKIDLSTLISIDAIQQKIQEAFSTPSYVMQEKALEEQLIDSEIALEEAERKRYLDFVQLRYRGPHDDLLKERVSVAFGFQIPTSSDGKLKIEELLMEKESLGSKYLIDEKRRASQIRQQIARIQLLIDERAFTQNLVQTFNEQSEVLAKRASQQQISNPLLLLYNKTNQLKQQLDLLDLEEDIYNEYLDLLELTGALYEVPFRNCLVE